MENMESRVPRAGFSQAAVEFIYMENRLNYPSEYNGILRERENISSVIVTGHKCN